MSRVLVTGATGFVGRRLVARLLEEGYAVCAAIRRPPSPPLPQQVETVTIPDLAETIDWSAALDGVDSVIHLASIAHASADIPEARYEAVNATATARLAQAARQAGVAHVVLMSSVRAQSGPSNPDILTEDSPPRPVDAYGRSKLAAEAAVTASGVPFTILRPVLVYAPGAKGNLAALARLAATPWPLPFKAFANRRSLVSLDNLVGAVLFVLHTKETVGETYLVAEPDAPTLAEIVTQLRSGRSPRLFALPPGLLRAVLILIGRADAFDRIGGSLVVSPARLIAAGWRPEPASLALLASAPEILDLAQ